MAPEKDYTEICKLPSNFRVVDHCDGGKCLLDTSTFKYYMFLDVAGKAIIEKKLYNYFDTIKEFVDSDFKTAIIPVFCNEVKKHKKRFFVKLLSGQDVFDFYNVEKIADHWTNNEIGLMDKINAYFIFVEKHRDADNDFIIRGCKHIEKK